MYKLELKNSNHDWDKTNLVTIMNSKGRKPHDELFCKKCGIKGRRYNLAEVEIHGRYDKKKVFSCPKATVKIHDTIPKKVKITNCKGYGTNFVNMEDNSVHEVVTPPDDYVNDHTGVWVMGVFEPLKLLAGEYTPI